MAKKKSPHKKSGEHDVIGLITKIAAMLTALAFQSTRPRGARPDGLPGEPGEVSIHAPVRGATKGRGSLP